MTTHSFRQWLRYRFDSFMARGGRSIFISLIVVFLTILATISIARGLAYHYLPPDASQNERWFLRNVCITFLEMTWQRTLDR